MKQLPIGNCMTPLSEKSVPRRRNPWLTALALATASTVPLMAQAADCNGVKEWAGSTIYEKGDQLQKRGVLYQAKQKIWNAPPDHPAGRHYYTKLGRCSADGDNTGNTGTAPANQAPSVLMIAPPNGRRFTIGSPIITSAIASDPDGHVSKVEFFRGNTLIGTSHQEPYSVIWRDAPAGTHRLSAVATDNLGKASAPVAVVITVAPADTGVTKDRLAPSVPDALSSTMQGTHSIGLRWHAATDNPGGSGVVAYDVYRDGKLIASPSVPAYTDDNLLPGTTYAYTVRARDKAGNASSFSAPLRVSTHPEANAGGSTPPESGGVPGNAGGDTAAEADKRLIGYFVQWGIYGRNYRLKNVDTSGSAARITHINYAFGNVRNNRCEVGITQPVNAATGTGGDAYADYTKAFSASESVSGRADRWNQPLRGNWNQLKQLKAKYPQLKVLISLGGWTWSRGFASAARPENRQAFVASCIDAYIKGNLPFTDNAGGQGAAAGVFDGIDVDWEYPAACGLTCGKPEDRENFTALLAEFRRQLDEVRPGLLLTAAVGAGVDKIHVTDPASYHRHLDFINVMTYDFHGGWEDTTNHHTPIFHSPADPSAGDRKLYNTHDAIEAFLNLGVPASKLNLGVGFYGRGWTNVAPTNNGLYQRGTPAKGTYESGIEDWKVLKKLGWPVYTDPVAKATWMYKDNTFWSLETPEQMAVKMGYVQAQNLGGAFFWEFSGDDAQGTLVKSISNGLR